MIYHNWSSPLPNPVNGCWTTIRPVGDTSHYAVCDASASPPKTPTPAGNTSGSWVYDDTSSSNHSYGSDGSIDQTYCSNHDAYWAEYMARSGGYVWDFSPTLIFEEDYDSSHNNYSYSGAASRGSWAHTASSYNPVPTLDAAGTSLSSLISLDCYKSPVYTSVYYISFYNGSNPANKESTIYAGLNSCYQ